MVEVVQLSAGLLLVAVALYDLTATTISLSSTVGPIFARLSAGIWWAFRRIPRRPSFLTRFIGPLVVSATLTMWLLLLSAGWILVFAVDGALASTASPDQQSADVRWVDAAFFVFGSLIGRNSGTLSPDQAWWSTAEAAMALTGVGLITLSLAWLLPIVSAVVAKRSLAARISVLGGTPQDIVTTSWNGRDLGDLNLHLLPLTSELADLAQRHLAYPVIHYFHSSAPRTAIGPRIAALDEALTLIRASGLDEDEHDGPLGRSVTTPLRQAISDYLSTLEFVFIRPAGDAPPPPPHGRLVEAGVVDDPDAFAERLDELCDELTDRRALLCGYVTHDGWDWAGITADEDAEETAPQDEAEDEDADEGADDAAA